jgi:flagellar protein FliO/FliZ
MSVYLVGMSTLASFFKLVMLLIVFILILIASYYSTKWYAKSGRIANKSPNIQILETFPLGPGRQICIIQLADKCVAVALGKDQVTFLTELDPEQLAEPTTVEKGSFQEIFGEQLKQKFRHLPAGKHPKE